MRDTARKREREKERCQKLVVYMMKTKRRVENLSKIVSRQSTHLTWLVQRKEQPSDRQTDRKRERKKELNVLDLTPDVTGCSPSYRLSHFCSIHTLRFSFQIETGTEIVLVAVIVSSSFLTPVQVSCLASLALESTRFPTLQI